MIHLVSSFLCTSCSILAPVFVILSVCWQYCVVTGYTEVALPPSISVLSAHLHLPLSLHFDTTAPTCCWSAFLSVHSCVSVCLQSAWCCSDVTEVTWTYRSLLYPFLLAAVFSLLHPSCAGSVNVYIVGVGDGESVPVNSGPVVMLSHLIPSSCHFFSVFAKIPQQLAKVWESENFVDPERRIVSHKWVTL